MTNTRRYPETPVGPFPEPPLSFVDDTDRTIEIRLFGAGPPASKDLERTQLTAMYMDFDPADRAQGIPPGTRDQVDSWLETLLDDNTINVLAWHDTTVAGHAVLVPETTPTGPHELAIFVHQNYQRAGIGSTLLEALLGTATSRGVTKIWLTVERWNDPAVHLYRKVGFEVTDAKSFELEMAIRLDG